jgi:hypothetical protein
MDVHGGRRVSTKVRIFHSVHCVHLLGRAPVGEPQ